ncbi:carbohydrate porin [Paraburkholderia sp. BCC1886]|uniref:carbohydrate porin n=1 Tax=Paraburkholderia sp. BCC1886 TaxID=2562670 RepID=UPI0011821CD1|nr:carbohydrate porin [Paraburkholderia sp. BCC1886]
MKIQYKSIALIASTLCCSSLACTASAETLLDGLRTSPHLLGDWDGERGALAQKGIDFDLSYTNEAAHNVKGGDQRLTRAAQQVAVGVTADLDKLWGIHNTSFHFVMTDRFGRSVDADAHLGTSQQTQEIYGRNQTVWLTKLTLDRTFFDNRLLLSVGRDSEGAAFDYTDCNFMTLALCGPQVPNLYGNYFMSWPGSVWMGRAKLQTSGQTYLQTGVYQQSPRYYDSGWERSNAWAPTSPGGTNGVVVPLEFGWTPKIGGQPGAYRLGFVYNTGGQPDILTDINGNRRAVTGLAGMESTKSYSGYFSVTQKLTGEGDAGWTVNLRLLAGDKQTSVLDRQMTLGFEYAEPFKRVGDRFGVGVAMTHTSSREAMYQAEYNTLHPGDVTYVGNGYETAYEVFYSWNVIPSISLQPDLQYISHPGGTTKNSNVFIVGLKTTVQF